MWMVQAITNETTSNQKVDQTFSFTTFKSRKLIRSTKATELIMDKSVHKYTYFVKYSDAFNVISIAIEIKLLMFRINNNI